MTYTIRSRRRNELESLLIGRLTGMLRRRAVDMPVKEPPVTTTVALPGAKVEEAKVELGGLAALHVLCSR